MNNREWITIPVLKYVAADATLNFWKTLGFVVTYRQDSPYKYAVIERKGCQLHFHHNKSANVSAKENGCLIIVSDVEHLHQEFCNVLKTALGKVPLSGLPRISRMKPAQTRFTLTDPSGNSVIMIQNGVKDQQRYESLASKGLSDMAKAIALAVKLRDFKEDYPAAAKTLDNALKKTPQEPDKDQQGEALIIRAELARILNDKGRENQCCRLLADLDLPSEKVLELKSRHNYFS